MMRLMVRILGSCGKFFYGITGSIERTRYCYSYSPILRFIITDTSSSYPIMGGTVDTTKYSLPLFYIIAEISI